MAATGLPKFTNDGGVAEIRIGAREFKCVGASPPHDHPHIFLDMGAQNAIVCPYCSTLFRFDPELAHGKADPPDSEYCE